MDELSASWFRGMVPARGGIALSCCLLLTSCGPTSAEREQKRADEIQAALEREQDWFCLQVLRAEGLLPDMFSPISRVPDSEEQRLLAKAAEDLKASLGRLGDAPTFTQKTFVSTLSDLVDELEAGALLVSRR
jgi:hypothetical protein